MTYNIYSVKDDKTGFSAPFIDSCDESAVRGFAFAFSNAPGLMSFSPADFRLYRIGKFDIASGHLTDELPTFVCDASSFVKVGVEDEK